MKRMFVFNFWDSVLFHFPFWDESQSCLFLNDITHSFFGKDVEHKNHINESKPNTHSSIFDGNSSEFESIDLSSNFNSDSESRTNSDCF